MKKLFLLTVLGTFIVTTTTAAPPPPPTRCFDIKIEARGAYILGVKINNNRNCKVGNSQTASMTMGETKTFKVSDRANVKLGAKLGKNTIVQIHDTGSNNQVIRCYGTTLIGFGCKYLQ